MDGPKGILLKACLKKYIMQQVISRETKTNRKAHTRRPTLGLLFIYKNFKVGKSTTEGKTDKLFCVTSQA